MFGSEHIYIVLLLAILIRSLVDIAFPSIPLMWRLGKKTAEKFSQKLDRNRRSMATRSLRGGLFLVFLFICAIVLSMPSKILQTTLYSDILAFLFFYICIGFASTAKQHSKVWRLLENTKDNRDEIISILQSLDIPISKVTRDKDIFVRLCITSIVYNLNRLLVAPIVWFILSGFIGMFFYILVMSAAIVLPRKEEFDFGWSVRMTARILDIIPSIITAILLFIASWSSFGAKPSAIIKSVTQNINNTATHGILLLQSVMAGSVGCVLGGMQRHWYIDKSTNDLWLGQKTDSAKASRKQLRSAIRLSIIAYALVLVLTIIVCINYSLTGYNLASL